MSRWDAPTQLIGHFERTRQGWRLVNFADPKGRFQLIRQCTWCANFMHDVAAENVYHLRFGRIASTFPHRRNSPWRDDGDDICTDCARIVKVTPVMSCDFCGAMKKHYTFGVTDRCLGSRFEEALGLSFAPTSDDLDYWRANFDSWGVAASHAKIYEAATRHTPRLCISCWNRLKPLRDLFDRAENARLLVGRVKRKIYEAAKERTRTDGSPGLHHGGGDQWRREGVGGATSIECGDPNYRNDPGRDSRSGTGLRNEADDCPVPVADFSDMAGIGAASH